MEKTIRMQSEGALSENGYLLQSQAGISYPSPMAKACPRFVVDANRHLVIVKFGKKVAEKDIENYVHVLSMDPRFDPSFSEIADISDVEELHLNGADFLKLADEVDPFLLESRRAFVAQTASQKHAARMHKILRTQRNFEIFDTLEDAEDWITK